MDHPKGNHPKIKESPRIHSFFTVWIFGLCAWYELVFGLSHQSKSDLKRCFSLLIDGIVEQLDPLSASSTLEISHPLAD
jgi:hypothetical protein